MLKHVAEGCVTVHCPLRDLPLKVYSQLSTFGGIFWCRCNGCDNESGHPACIECKAAMERHWTQLHEKYPDRSASQLTNPPPRSPV